MPVIAFANSKGGSGKTTSALLLACELAETTDVTIIDADPRHPISKWATPRDSKSVPPKRLTVLQNDSENTIIDEIEEAAARDPFVIIDLEGVASKKNAFAISQADLVIIPMKEQQQDAEAALDVIKELVTLSKMSGKKLPFSVLFTQTKVVAKSRTSRFIAKQFRDNARIDCFNVEVNERDAFAAIYTMGGSIRTLDAKQTNGIDRAVENITGFAAEVVTKLRAQNIDKQGRAA
ncbi:MAG: ParA family protein [Flavobacteriaceae bacterium]|nr:ParA family protein [Flavobacteriaceae bacterium]